ncbi:hypothetical protein PUR28_16215 [Streptomyces sp. BE308]|uniref:hypothetical protein n=1 Tax=Streptomyces sp. BE308 TaxID=3002529 RepID=UPI002E775C68|nr:hypothetical protein [Streptomyces sp. BE308]MEE1792294.1 hypothetical protein [Streptomyces sp. BE308]
MSSPDEGHEAQLAAPEVNVESDGRLTVPAEHVTALLRSIARSWQAGAYDGVPVMTTESGPEISLEPVTVRSLADVLDNIANQLDVQYIHITTHTTHTE